MKIVLEHFPTWRYHKKHGARLFQTQEEYDKAGAGWVDSPDKLNMPVEQAKPEPEPEPEIGNDGNDEGIDTTPDEPDPGPGVSTGPPKTEATVAKPRSRRRKKSTRS